MADSVVRLGIVGAGSNMRTRHLPGFGVIPGVEVVGVVNRTPESTHRAAREFRIPRTYGHWQELVADPQVDAVVIGTWPNLHCEVTCAALDAGKHVLTEARMARNLTEARLMLAAAERHPRLVAQVVPSPYGLMCGPVVTQLVRDGYLGDLREIVVIGADSVFWDYSKPIHWRQNAELSGMNVLSLGILHETLLRWTPPPVRVFAQSMVFEPYRPDLQSHEHAAVTVPDSLQVLTELANGARAIYHISGIALFGPGKQIHLYGSRGTIRVEFEPEERVLVGHYGDPSLKPMELAAERLGRWRVEEEFVGAIRGKESVRLTDFRTGVQYMEFVEAVWRSSREGKAQSLPLT
jgi:predicted dehydrogenase